jgi:hypothetical protein
MIKRKENKNMKNDFNITLGYNFNKTKKHETIIKNILSISSNNPNVNLEISYLNPALNAEIFIIAKKMVEMAKKQGVIVYANKPGYLLKASPKDNPEQVVHRFLKSVFEKYSSTKVRGIYTCFSATSSWTFLIALRALSRVFKRKVIGKWYQDDLIFYKAIEILPSDSFAKVCRKFRKTNLCQD